MSRPPVRGWSTRLGVGGGLVLAAVAWGASPAAAAPPSGRGAERPELATEASRSFRQADGSIVKRFYGDPVNVKDAQGRWRHIDTGLARDGATLKAKTTRVPITLPKDLADAPVTVGSPGQAASVSPVGLAGTATVEGDTASYVDRSRGVETRLAALPDGVKQSYVLRNASAPSRLDVALRVSAGFSVRKGKDGGATVVDADGKARFELSPTFAWPEGDLSKARPVPTEIVRDGDAWRVRLDLSSRWIRKALKHGPVVVDPTLSVPSPIHDAVINSQFPTYNAGWSTAMGFVATAWKQASPQIEFRSLLRFDLNDLPQDADVLSASIGLHVAPHSPVPPSTGIDIAMHEATSAWESDAATWISRLPTASWTVPGGDYVGSAVATATDVRQTDGWREWGVTSLVRRWASGTSANHGVVLKAASVSPEEIYFAGRTATGAYADQKPYLQVHYAPPAEPSATNPGTGDTGFFTFRPSAAVGGTQINVASGNALVRTRDLSDSLLNYHVVVDRAYNSLASDTFSILSPRWGFDVGPATRVAVQGNGDALVTGPSGYKLRFVKQTDGTFTAPADFDGSLVKTASGWTLNRTSQGDQFGFDNSGTLSWTKDAAVRDFTVQGTSAAGRDVLSSYGTSSGRRVNLSYTGDSLVREMDDPSSGHHYYRYTAGRLTAYESPSGQITSYRYDSNGLLDKITEPGGTTVELDVAASGRVRSITTTLPGGFPQTTSFVYTRRTYKSDVTGPDNVRRTYAYDDDWRVTRQYNPDQAPSVTASAELRELAGGYVGPNRTYPVNVAATQPDGAGLRRLWLTLVPESELAGENVPCTTTPFDLVCPQTFDVPLDIDFAPLPEGPTTLRGAALDDEQNRGNSAAWEVTVDKTAPVDVAASGELFDARDGYINGQGTKTLTAAAVDPNMSNGTRLSGIKRLQLEDVGHGIVAATDVSCTALACPVTANETLNVDASQLAEGAHQLRVVATDLVGNVSRSDAWTVFVDRTGPTAPHSVTTDFDEDEATAHLSWDADDPLLADGSPGSGIGGYHVTYTVSGTTRQTTSEAPSIELEGAEVGDQVSVAINGVDAVSNAGATTTQTVTVAALSNCDVTVPVNDPVPVGLLPGAPTQQADVFVFAAPVSPGDLLAALPAGARVVSVLDRDPSPAAEHSSGMLIPEGQSTASALAYWNSTLSDDLTAEKNELIAARDNSTLPAYVAQVDRQLAQVQTRRQRMTSASGVPVRAMSVVHDPSVAAAITTAFSGNLTTAATVLPTADCEGINGDPIDADAADPQARGLPGALPQPTEVKDYTIDSYSPPFIRVHTELDDANKRHKVTVAWKYVAASNLQYWRSKYRRYGTARGTEIQFDMNLDGGGEAFGYPWWYDDPWNLGPAPPDQQNATPNVWNANFKCAYPDDYFMDNRPNFSLTIGMHCRPTNIYKRYRWSHFVTHADDHDGITVSAAPGHYGQRNHAGIPGSPVSERHYCDFVGLGRWGSCMYGDHGPPTRKYNAPGGANMAMTPSDVVFARRRGN